MNVQNIFSAITRPPKVQFIKYRAAHLMELADNDPEFFGKYVKPGHALALESTEGFTAVRNDRVIACGGLIEHWQGRCEAWLHFAKGIGPFDFMAVHRFAKGVVEYHPARRIEVCLNYRSTMEARWVRSLGFHLEIPRMQNYWPDNRDASKYVRIR